MAGAISVSTMPPMPSSPVSVDTSVRRSASSRRDSATVAEPENIYQLLGLVAERSSSGIVDKFIISQDSVGRLIQSIAPGAYESITNIDFAALDSILLKPVGIYGSESELVAFLGRFGVNVRQMRTRLPTGLYFIRGQAEPHSGAHRGYVVYWPEPNTWDDDANASVKRNRVTFMRYLTKITRQIVSLISDEHARALVWEKEDPPQAASANHLRPNQPAKLARRVYSFGVERTKEQRESVSTRPGSTINLLNGVAGTASQLGPMSPRLIPGDERQAVITGAEVPARWLGTKADVFLTPLQLKAFLRDSTRTFSLGSELTESAINTLVNAGLVQRHEALVDAYHSDLAGMEVAKQDELTFRRMEVDDALALDNPRLQDHVKNQFIGALSGMHRWAENPLRAMEIDLVAQGPPQGQHVHELDELDPSTILRINQFASVDPGQFQSLKARFSVVTDIITRNALRLNAHKFYRLDAAILAGGNTFYNVISDLNQDIATASVEASGSRGFMHKMKKSFRHMFGTGHDVVKQRVDESARVDDLVFLNEQLFQPAWGSSFPRSVAELNRLATSWLRAKIDSKTTVIAQAISAEQNAVIKEVSDSVVEMRFFEMRKPRLDVFVRDLNQAEQTRQECVHLEEIHSFAGPQPSPESPSTEVFAISKTLSEEDPAHIKYTVQPIGLTAADVQGVTADLEHIPTPIVLSSAQWELRLQPGSTLKATHVFPNGKYLVVIMDEVDSKVRFYLETETTMPSALRERKATRQIDFARVGADFIMTVDEIKRLVCLYSRLDNRLFTYAMDETFSTLRSKGGELDLFSISENPLGEIETVALIPGREEVVFVDNSGLTKIISLVTEKFKNGSIRLSEGTHSVLCSPDATCTASRSSSRRNQATLRSKPSSPRHAMRRPSHPWVPALELLYRRPINRSTTR
ncbi:hypothetical protein DL93DRAFT_246104 [Clavulina sp. PMI_390]|nr:hypothetical protein DL93DRAFT_246104 [Clavulina sp. PMI_390]